MEKIGFTYEPLALTRLMLQIHLEKEYNGNEEHSQSVRFAVFEYLRTLEDEELEGLLNEYVTKDNIEYITFEDNKDCERIAHYMMLTDRFNDLVFRYQKQGCSGLGVADNSDKTFYECNFAEHWQTVGFILRKKYPKHGGAFDEIMYGMKKEHNGITSDELDKFILDRFELIGGNKPMESYFE